MHRTESAELSDDLLASLWKHTPPLEGRGRAVRRKVNGRVTGWNPLSLHEGEGAGGETGKETVYFCTAFDMKTAFLFASPCSPKRRTPLRGFPRALFRAAARRRAAKRGRPLLQGVPSCKNSPPDCFCNSPLAERLTYRIPRLRSRPEAARLWTLAAF